MIRTYFSDTLSCVFFQRFCFFSIDRDRGSDLSLSLALSVFMSLPCLNRWLLFLFVLWLLLRICLSCLCACLCQCFGLCVCVCVLFQVCLSFVLSVFSVRVNIFLSSSPVYTCTYQHVHVDVFKSFMHVWTFACLCVCMFVCIHFVCMYGSYVANANLRLAGTTLSHKINLRMRILIALERSWICDCEFSLFRY